MNILVVEDTVEVRTSIAEFLRQAGNVVAECGNWQQALEHLAGRRAHLALCDIQMPAMDRRDLLPSAAAFGTKSPRTKASVIFARQGVLHLAGSE
jgi:CheY-like chemotaxis protein